MLDSENVLDQEGSFPQQQLGELFYPSQGRRKESFWGLTPNPP